MIRGQISSKGLPTIWLPVVGQAWSATIDTGFGGYLELPEGRRASLDVHPMGYGTFVIAGARRVVELEYLLRFPFHGEFVPAVATFSPRSDILVGMAMLRGHRLTVDVPAGDVLIERVRD